MFYVVSSHAAFSRFVAITPDNEKEYPFLIQVQPVKDIKSQSRIKVSGSFVRDKHVWLIVCEKPLQSKQLYFRDYIWYGVDKGTQVVRLKKLQVHKLVTEKAEKQTLPYVEIVLNHEEMRRAYLYIDFPTPVKDGGYYYAIDLAFYMQGKLGKKKKIEWESN